MKDCDGRSHPDDAPITWRQFDREMEHRNNLFKAREEAFRTLIAVASLIVICIQLLVLFRK